MKKQTQVENMLNGRGNAVPNQFIITTSDGKYFQSYNSTVAFIPNNGHPVQIGKDWEYSKTTGKYRNMFLRETKKETLKKLNNGTYVFNPNL